MSLPTGLHHVEVNVSHIGRSTRFWGFLLAELGFSPYQTWEGGRSWRLGDTYLVFVQVAERHADRGFHRSGTGLNHLAFHGGSRDNVDRLADELRRRGTPMLYKDRYPHAGGPSHYALFCEDSDRIKVEIVASSSKPGSG